MNELQKIKIVPVTPPGAIVDNASWTTAEIDTQGFDYLTVLVQFGAMDIAATALKLQESDASGSGFADASGFVYGTSTDLDGNTSSLPSATSDNTAFLFQVDLRGHKRYWDLVATGGDGTAGTYMCAVAVLSRGKIAPNTIAEMGCAGVLRG